MPFVAALISFLPFKRIVWTVETMRLDGLCLAFWRPIFALLHVLENQRVTLVVAKGRLSPCQRRPFSVPKTAFGNVKCGIWDFF